MPKKTKTKPKSRDSSRGSAEKAFDRPKLKLFYEAEILSCGRVILKRDKATNIEVRSAGALLHFMMIADRMGLLTEELLQNVINQISNLGGRFGWMYSRSSLADNPTAISEAFHKVRSYMEELPRVSSKRIVILIGEDHFCRYSYIQTLLAMISAVAVFNPSRFFVEFSDRLLRNLKTYVSPIEPNFSGQKALSNALGLEIKAVDDYIDSSNIPLREAGIVKKVISSTGDGILVCGYKHLKPLKAGMEKAGLQVIAIGAIGDCEDDIFSPQISATPYGLTEVEIAELVEVSLRDIGSLTKVHKALDNWARNIKSDKKLPYVERLTRENPILHPQEVVREKAMDLYKDSISRLCASSI